MGSYVGITPRENHEMRNREKWKPSKYVYKNGRLIASRDLKQVRIGSRLITDLVAGVSDENIKKHVRGKLLDLGCGKVPLYESYKPFIIDNICVDWINTPHENEYVDHDLDLTKQLPFSDNEFDTIILSDVLEHIPMPEQLWKEMARILSKNGKIIMNVPFYYWLHEKPHDYYRYTEFALQRFVKTSGLKLIKIEAIGGAPEIMADIFAKNILQLPRMGRSIAALTQYLVLCFTKTKFGNKISRNTSQKFPFLYFLVAEKSH
jgi:SAM-dependent methyltransferase